MSGRSPRNSHDRYHHSSSSHDDVESYRQRSRQNDRRYRDREERGSSSSDHRPWGDDRQTKLARDREQRMARLREELKKEDETLAALDKQQQEHDDDNDPTAASSQPQDNPQETIIEVNPDELEGMDPEEQMRRLLGFEGFGSTKGQAVEDNQSTAARGGAAKNKARKYRQYMNRKSGFNRPLEKMN